MKFFEKPKFKIVKLGDIIVTSTPRTPEDEGIETPKVKLDEF